MNNTTDTNFFLL